MDALTFLLAGDVRGIYKALMSETSGQIAGHEFQLHHVGIAVLDLQQAVDFYCSALNLRIISGPIEDPIQKVRACFLSERGRVGGCLELICPLDETSPVNGYLKQGIGAYHTCYEVSDIESAVRDLRRKGCLTISAPVPAVAFSQRRIAWCFTPTRHLLELLERAKA